MRTEMSQGSTRSLTRLRCDRMSSASDRRTQSPLEWALSVLVPAALIAALGAGLTIWREYPLVNQRLESITQSLSEIKGSTAGLQDRVIAIEIRMSAIDRAIADHDRRKSEKGGGVD
jgi:hypothetical protein